MIRHLVVWRLLPTQTAEEKRKNALLMQEKFAELGGKVPGIVHMKLEIDMLTTSNFDVIRDSVFESEAALKAYQKNPEHLAVAKIVATLATDRTTVDFAEKSIIVRMVPCPVWQLANHAVRTADW